MGKTSDYERQCEEWRKKFLTMDQEDVCRRLPGIEKDEEHLLLWHYGRRSAVDRNDGTIRAVSDDRAVDIMPKLNLWDADDEFPAQANLLFDSSATDLAHVESIVTIATEALYQLVDVSGVPMKGSPFYRF